jgi:hypothetical protein
MLLLLLVMMTGFVRTAAPARDFLAKKAAHHEGRGS